MLAKIYILFSKCFHHYALITISNNDLFCVVSIFDYHKEKSPPILRLHCVRAGRPYDSFIFQKHYEYFFTSLVVVVLKDK